MQLENFPLSIIPQSEGKSAFSRDICILVDGSSSIVPTDFELMRRICLAIVAKYKGFHETSIQFALVLFSNYGQIQCQLSLHRADIEGAITAMPHPKGGTNIDAGLAQVQAVFNAGRAGAKKQLWVLTDGEYNGGTHCYAADTLRTSFETDIVVIGIGMLQHYGLNRIASPGRVFLAENFVAALNLVSSSKIPLLMPAYAYEIEEACVPTKSARLGQPLTVNICLGNIGTKPLPRGCLLRLTDGSGCFRPARYEFKDDLGSSQAQTYSVVLRPVVKGPQSMIDTLPQKISVHLYLPETIQLSQETTVQAVEVPCEQDGVRLEWQIFAGFLQQWNRVYPKDNSKLNILLFGHQGSGKSSFINSVYSVFSSGAFSEIARVDRNADGVTTKFEKYKMTSRGEAGFIKLPLTCYDIPGYEEDSLYRGEEIELIMSGLLPLKTDLKVRGEIVKAHYLVDYEGKRDSKVVKKQQMHAVIMLTALDQGSGAAENRILQKMKVFRDRIRDKTLHRPVIVASQVDKIDEEDIESLRTGIQTVLDDGHVLLLENYRSKDIHKDFEKERRIVRVLYFAVEAANNYLERQRLEDLSSSSEESQSDEGETVLASSSLEPDARHGEVEIGYEDDEDDYVLSVQD